MSVGVQFGGPDRVSMRFLESWPGGMFIAPGIDHDDPGIRQWLLERYFVDGAPLFTPETPVGVQYFVLRVRNYAHIEILDDAVIRTAKVVGDCHIGHRDVNVMDAALRIGWMKTLTPDQYEMFAYGADLGFPPFTIKCRCRLEGIVPGVEN